MDKQEVENGLAGCGVALAIALVAVGAYFLLGTGGPFVVVGAWLFWRLELS